jgi:hypothetical protein
MDLAAISNPMPTISPARTRTRMMKPLELADQATALGQARVVGGVRRQLQPAHQRADRVPAGQHRADQTGCEGKGHRQSGERRDDAGASGQSPAA